MIKAEPLSGDGARSALQGQGLTPTETLEENGLNIHSRQADAVFGKPAVETQEMCGDTAVAGCTSKAFAVIALKGVQPLLMV